MKGRFVAILLIIFFTSPLSAQELTGTLKQIKQTGQVKIGYRSSEPPMSFIDKNGQPAGYSIDLAKNIVKEIEKVVDSKVKTIYVPVSAEDRFKALIENKIDILCGSTTKTLSRMKLVDFTQLTFVTGASLMMLRTNTSVASSGFGGKKIGVVRDTTTAIELKNLIKDTSTKAQIVLFDSAKEGMKALMAKEIDAFSADQVVLIGLALKSGTPAKFQIDTNVYSFEPFAFAVRKNDSDFRLVADTVLSRLYRSNKIIQIYNKWIGAFIGQRSPLFDAMVKLNSTPE